MKVGDNDDVVPCKTEEPQRAVNNSTSTSCWLQTKYWDSQLSFVLNPLLIFRGTS